MPQACSARYEEIKLGNVTAVRARAEELMARLGGATVAVQGR